MLGLLQLMLFVYFKYTIHLIPKDIRRIIDFNLDALVLADPEAGEAVARAKMKVESASKQRKPVLVDQDGQSLTAEKQSIMPDPKTDIDDGCEPDHRN